MRKQNTTQRGTLLLLLALGVFIMMFPFLWTFITSITPNGSLSAGPSLIVKNPTWDAYRQLFATLPMGRIILNSVFVTVISTVLQLITGSMAGYAFARLEFPGKKVLFSLYLATMMIPLQVLITPLFTLFKDLNLHDTYFALIAPTVTSVFGVFMLRQAIRAVPKELDEAATIDGAGHLQIFGRIILPLIKPSLATVGVMAFMNTWNSFLWPLIAIRSPEYQTLPLGLSVLHGQFTTEWNIVMAGSVISIIPIAVFYLFAQRYIIEGVAHSGLK